MADIFFLAFEFVLHVSEYPLSRFALGDGASPVCVFFLKTLRRRHMIRIPYDQYAHFLANCISDDPCFLNRKNTIFHCPARNLFSTEEYITFEEWVPQDITDDSNPLRQQHKTVEIHGIPPPKRIKHIWNKQTKTKFQFTQHIFK